MTEPHGRLALIVEDNPANLMLARAVLERDGYRTETARTAEEALDRLGRARPDLILMDVQLPGRDGLALTQQLKADPSTAGIPIVAVTAHALADDRERVLAAGCDGYISKPIKPRTFVFEIEAVLRRRSDGGEGDGA